MATTLLTANFNDALPNAPVGKANVKWQADPPNLTRRNISAYVPNLGGVDARTTTAEIISDSSRGKLVTLANAAPIAVTLQVGSGVAGAILALVLGTTGGTGYAVSDTFTIAGGTGGTGHVTAVAAGVVTAVALNLAGSGYSANGAAATTATSGSGTGLTVGIVSVAAAVDATGFMCWVTNESVGVATLTPATGTIDLGANLLLKKNEGVALFWDGTNWETDRGIGAAIAPVGAVITVTQIALAPGAAGNFSVAHGLGVTPKFVLIQMTSGGNIWMQTPTLFDATDLYLVASDPGATALATIWTVTADSEVSVASSGPGPWNITVPHGLGATPKLALLEMTSSGGLWFQSTPWDAVNLYLTASDAGVTAKVEVWLVIPIITVVKFTELALAPGAAGNFTVAHGLSKPPTSVMVRMSSSGAIWLQSPVSSDSTNIYLVASDAGVTGEAEVWTS
jgi:hypothetical protein